MKETVEPRRDDRDVLEIGDVSVQGNAVSLSLILPAYNEQEVIETAVREAERALRRLNDQQCLTSYEIIVVDDGGGDRTGEIVSELQAEIPSLRLVRHEVNRGYGAALQSGFAAATKNLIAFTDADCQFDLRELDRFLLLAEDYDFVCGYRIDRQDAWPRSLYSRGFNFACRWLLGTPVRDIDCALKVMRAGALRSLKLDSQGFFINAELLSRARMAGARIVEVGVTHRPRLLGKSSVSPWQVIPIGAALLRHWWRVVAFPARVDADGRDKAPPARWPLRKEIGAVLLLLTAALLLFLPNLSYPLFEPDEMRYGQIAIEMHESGDWITPRLFGEPYLDKPPLTYWLTAAAFGLFGESEATSRLPCVLAGTLCVLAVFFLGRRLVGDLAAWLGALALLLSGGFVLSSRFLLLDGPFSLLVTCALLSLYIARRDGELRWRWWLAGAVAAGLACLAKGPAALLLIAPPLAAFQWLSPERPALRLRHFAVYGVVWLAITAPWFVAISMAQPTFFEYFFWKHNVVRFVSAFDHEQPWWFYVPILAVSLLPATAAIPWTAKFLFSRERIDRQRRTPAHGFLLLWAAWVILFFSLSSCKLAAYVLPAFPPLCLLIGAVLAARLRWEWSPAQCGASSGWEPARITIAAIGIAAMVDWLFLPESVLGYFVDPLLAIAAAAVFALLGRIPKLRPGPVWAVTAGMSYAAVLFAACDIVPEIAERRSVHAAAAYSRRDDGATHSPVVYFGRNPYAARFYFPGEVVRRMPENELSKLRDMIREDARVMIVTRPDLAPKLKVGLADIATVEAVANRRDLLVVRSATPIAKPERPAATTLR